MDDGPDGDARTDTFLVPVRSSFLCNKTSTASALILVKVLCSFNFLFFFTK